MAIGFLGAVLIAIPFADRNVPPFWLLFAAAIPCILGCIVCCTALVLNGTSFKSNTTYEAAFVSAFWAAVSGNWAAATGGLGLSAATQSLGGIGFACFGRFIASLLSTTRV